MSKTTVKKAIALFEATELRQLLLEVYSKSKDAREILDFYADPDIGKKLEEYKTPITKEVNRITRRVHRPRMSRIKEMIRRFKRLDTDDAAVAELMAHTIMEFCRMAADEYLKDATVEAVRKLMEETLEFMRPRAMLPDYLPRFEKRLREMRDKPFSRNPLKRALSEILSRYD